MFFKPLSASRTTLTARFGAGVCCVLLLSGCAGDVPMHPAKDANNPLCADVVVRLPQQLGDDLPRRQTNAQATGAWGNPDAVTLRCGIKPSGPTTQQCVSVNGVDWIIDDSQKPLYRFEAYGRDPGLEVVVDSRKASGTDVMMGLAPVVKLLPQKRHCVSAKDLFAGSTPKDPSE